MTFGVCALEHGSPQPVKGIMDRIGCHNDPFSLERLDGAYRACRRHKRTAIDAMRFEVRLLDNLVELREELVDRTYRPGPSLCFVQTRPKLREIFAAPFRDRVVHHLLVSQLEPRFERIFIHDSYACRKQRGVHAAVRRLRQFLNKVSRNGTRRAWFLKEDIAGFFMNIDKTILYERICARCRDEDLRWLARVLIFHDCTADYRFKGNRRLLAGVPPHKSLFRAAPGKGLPIGNLSSQFFANVYLNELDQFVKRRLKCRYYLRYCDDFLLLSADPDELDYWDAQVGRFLRDGLHLSLNRRQFRIEPISAGIDFLGYVVRRKYTLVRRRVVNHFRERLDEFERQCREVRGGRPVAWRYPPAVMATLRCVTASYLGHFRWADSRRLVASLFRRHPVLGAAFVRRGCTVVPRYLQGRPGRYRQGRVLGGWKLRGRRLPLRKLYRWWVPAPLPEGVARGQRPILPLGVGFDSKAKVLVFFPVGSFYEFYDAQADLAADVLSLATVPGLRGFHHGCGFHRRWLGRYLTRALKGGYHVALLRADKGIDAGVRRRLAKMLRAHRKDSRRGRSGCDRRELPDKTRSVAAGRFFNEGKGALAPL